MNGNFARSILCSLVTSVDFGWYSSIVGTCWFFFAACSCCVAAARSQPRRAADKTTKMMEKNVMVRQDVIVPFWFLDLPIIFPQDRERAESSVRIARYATARAAPFPFARRTKPGRRDRKSVV